MSITITNLKELEKRGELENNDVVIFTVKKETIKYKVVFNYLHNLKSPTTGKYNNEIFKILELDKVKIAQKAYGDIPVDPISIPEPYWPSIKEENYPALTKLVKKLYLIIEEQYPAKVYTKFTRFEIMDI